MRMQNHKQLLRGSTPISRVRGLARPRAESAPAVAEIKAALDAMQKSWETMKAEMASAKTSADANDVVHKNKIEALNSEISAHSKTLDELARKVAAAQIGPATGKDAELSPEAREHRKAFAGYFRKGDIGAGDTALEKLAVKAALTSTSDPDGGYTVPETVETAIDRLLENMGAIRSLASVINISTPTYKKLVTTTGLTGAWVGEEQARPTTDNPKLSQIEINAMEMYANPAATQTLLDDSAVDIEAWLAEEVAMEFAEMESDAFINGNGVNKPRGILSYTPVANASWTWGKIGFVVSGVAAALSDSSNNGVDAMINLIYSLRRGYRQNGAFVMNDLTLAAARKLKNTNGEYLWQPSTQLGVPSQLLGYPVETDDYLTDIGANAFPIWFGDWQRGYQIVDRVGIRVLRDPYTNKPYVNFYTTKRVGGGIKNFQALKALKIST